MAPEASLTRRITFITALTIVVVMIFAALASAILIRSYAERALDARIREDAQVLLTGISFDRSGILAMSTLPESPAYVEPHSGWYWAVHSGHAMLAKSRSLVASSLAPGAAASASSAKGPAGESLRSFSIMRAADSRGPVTVTVAAPTAAIDEMVGSEVSRLVAGLLALGAVLVSLVWWQVARSLAPLDKLTRDVTSLADGGLDKLPPAHFAELARLTSTINALLDHSRHMVASHRDRAAKLAHALKTPLALIAARADGQDGERDEKVLDAVAAMRRQIDHNLRRARTVHRSPAFAVRVPIKPVVDDLMFALGHAHGAGKLTQSITIDDGVHFVGDREDLEEMLGNLIQNGYRWAESLVAVSARIEQHTLFIEVEDDGPGFPDAILQAHSSSLRAPDERSPGGGLGIALTRDIAAAHSGTLSLINLAPLGAKAVLRFPAPQQG